MEYTVIYYLKTANGEFPIKTSQYNYLLSYLNSHRIDYEENTRIVYVRDGLQRYITIKLPKGVISKIMVELCE